MPRALGFDGDSAYYESLRAKILADEAAKDRASEEAGKERRKSIGLPETEHGEPAKDPARKKSVGEKVMNFIWNGNRSEERETRQASKVGGLKDRKAGPVEHGTPEIIS